MNTCLWGEGIEHCLGGEKEHLDGMRTTPRWDADNTETSMVFFPTETSMGVGGEKGPRVFLSIEDTLGHMVGAEQHSRELSKAEQDKEGTTAQVWNDHLTFEGLTFPRVYVLNLSLVDQDANLGIGAELGSVIIKLGVLAKTKQWQTVQVILKDGATLDLALNTLGEWGDAVKTVEDDIVIREASQEPRKKKLCGCCRG